MHVVLLLEFRCIQFSCVEKKYNMCIQGQIRYYEHMETHVFNGKNVNEKQYQFLLHLSKIIQETCFDVFSSILCLFLLPLAFYVFPLPSHFSSCSVTLPSICPTLATHRLKEILARKWLSSGWGDFKESFFYYFLSSLLALSLFIFFFP